MSSQTIVSVSNLALLSIGGRSQIQSLNEGTPQSDACAKLYNFVFESLARSAYWNCLRSQQVLTLIAAAQGTPENPDGTTLPLPDQPWLYAYALPNDSLAIRFIMPTVTSVTGNSVSAGFNQAAPTLYSSGQLPFRVAYSTDSTGGPINIILCNQTQAQAVYTVNQPNPAIWDSLFTSAFVSSLAAYLAPALSLNLPLGDRCIAAAKAMIEQARVRDGNESPTSQDHQPDWISARGGSSASRWNAWGSSGLFNYTDMVFPGAY